MNYRCIPPNREKHLFKLGFKQNSCIYYLQVVIETVTSTGDTGYAAIDDFLFDPGKSCQQLPEDSIPPNGSCNFQTDLCGEWVLPQSPELSFWNRTNALDLQSSGIQGPAMDELDDVNGRFSTLFQKII